jgi:UPF0716 protein FxsA
MRFFLMLLPWLELFSLIQLGIETSALTALLYVLATVVLGLAILRRQGFSLFERVREQQSGQLVGPQLLLDDMAIGLAGMLLLIPGLISDVGALLVMIGPLRRRLARWLAGPQPERFRAADTAGRDAQPPQRATIEGEYRRVDDQ